MPSFRLALICILLLVTTLSHAEDSLGSDSTYIVTYVYDGDTVKLSRIDRYGSTDASKANNSQDEFKLRLNDIDAPERNQAYGLKSRRALIDLCYGASIIATVKISGIDKYHRALGRLQCNNVDASLHLAERGLAWHYAQYSSDVEIDKASKNARRLTLGLWADDNPIPPWVWRRQFKRAH